MARRFSILLAMTAAACSPSIFMDEGPDASVSDSPGYRRTSDACADLNLSDENLDTASFLQMISCLNSTGAIEPVERLVRKLSPEELLPLVDFGNQYFVNDKKRLYQLEATYRTLEKKGLLDSTTLQLGRLLENEDFVASSIALVKDIGYVRKTALDPLEIDRDLLTTMELVGKEITHESVADTLDFLLSFAGARSVQALQEKFAEESPRGRTLNDLTEALLAYAELDADPKHVRLAYRFLELLAQEKAFPLVDRIAGASMDELVRKLPDTTAFMKVGFSGAGAIFDSLTTLFHYAHQPIECLDGTKSVPDAGRFVAQEMLNTPAGEVAEFVKRRNLLTLVTVNPFCVYPEPLGQHYRALIELADTPAIEPTADLMRAFHEHGLIDLLLDALADTGSVYPDGPAENTSGIKLLIPVLSELTDREVWDDLILSAALLRVEDRGKVASAARFVLEPRPEMGRKMIFQVLKAAFARVNHDAVHTFVASLRRFAEQKEPLMVPGLQGLRTAYYVNEVHPLVDVAAAVLANSTKHEALLDTMFAISTMDEFKETIRLASAMGKDGRLKDLLKSTFMLFHRYAELGKTDIRETEEPPFVARRRHELRASDLAIAPIARVAWDASDPCRAMDLNLKMDDYSNEGFENQLTLYLSCLNKDGKHADVVDALNFLRTQKTESGKSFFNFQIDLLKSLELTPDQLTYLGDQWIVSYDDGRFSKLLDAIPYWIPVDPASTEARERDASPVYHLAKFAGPLLAKRTEFSRLEGYGAKVVRWSEFPEVLSYLADFLGRDAGDAPYPATPPSVYQKYNITNLQKWVRNTECEYSKIKQETRALEIASDYESELTTWDLVDGHVRKSWSRNEIWAELQPVFMKFFDPRQSSPDRWVGDAMLNHLKYFTLRAGADGVLPPPNQKSHYPPEYLGQWLHELSHHTEVISYFFPGETKPRARIVNGLDLLELVVINADFSWGLPTNFGLKFLAEIGEAWGDEPREVWPVEIQKRFPRDRKKRPKTLREAVGDIYQTLGTFEFAVGYPDLPGCPMEDPDPEMIPHDPPGGGAPDWAVPHWVKASLYNNRQVLRILDQALPGSGHLHDGKLRVLRDLFWEMYMSTPAKLRKPTKDWANNLKLVIKLVRMGLTRQIARIMMEIPERDEEFNQFFRSFVAATESPEVPALLRQLTTEDQRHEVLWKLVFQIFDILEDRDEREVARMKQFGFYFIAMVEPLAKALGVGPLGVPLDETQAGARALLDPLGGALRQILSDNRDYLLENADRIREVLTNQELSARTKMLYDELGSADATTTRRIGLIASLLRDAIVKPEGSQNPLLLIDAVTVLRGLDEDGTAFDSLQAAIDSAKAIVDNPGYQATGASSVSGEVLDFFEAYPASELAVTIREYAAKRMESGDIDQMLLLMSRDPDEFYDFLQTISGYLLPTADGKQGELRDFFDLTRRTFSPALSQ